MADDLKGVVVWNNLLIDGRDYCGLWHTAVGRLLKGTVVGVLKDQRPLLASYEIHCDENWLTHRVQVDRALGNNAKTLSLSLEKRGVWRSTGQECARGSRYRCFCRASVALTKKPYIVTVNEFDPLVENREVAMREFEHLWVGFEGDALCV